MLELLFLADMTEKQLLLLPKPYRKRCMFVPTERTGLLAKLPSTEYALIPINVMCNGTESCNGVMEASAPRIQKKLNMSTSCYPH
jgi:hypothetical protein